MVPRRSTQAGTDSRGAAFTHWVAIPGTEDEDILHMVAAGDGEDADGGTNEDAPARSRTWRCGASFARRGRWRCGASSAHRRQGPPLRGRGRWGGIGAVDRGRGVVESGAMGVAAPCWGRDDSERFARYCLESYLRHEFGPPELDQIPSFDSVVGQTG
jgi:hypothetical protein